MVKWNLNQLKNLVLLLNARSNSDKCLGYQMLIDNFHHDDIVVYSMYYAVPSSDIKNAIRFYYYTGIKLPHSYLDTLFPSNGKSQDNHDAYKLLVSADKGRLPNKPYLKFHFADKIKNLDLTKFTKTEVNFMHFVLKSVLDVDWMKDKENQRLYKDVIGYVNANLEPYRKVLKSMEKYL